LAQAILGPAGCGPVNVVNEDCWVTEPRLVSQFPKNMQDYGSAGRKSSEFDDLFSEQPPSSGGFSHLSHMKAFTLATLICALLWLSLLTLRLQLKGTASWPVFIDFVPLWMIPCILYLASIDFATTRIEKEASLGRSVIIAGGFLAAFTVLALGVFIALKFHKDIEWTWMATLAPLWPMLVAAQFLMCFLIPGVLKSGAQREFFALFGLVWMLPLTALLCGLKLDEDMPSLHWGIALLPAELALAAIAAISLVDPEEAARPAAALLVLLLLSLNLDGVLEIPWVFIFLPGFLALLASLLRVIATNADDF